MQDVPEKAYLSDHLVGASHHGPEQIDRTQRGSCGLYTSSDAHPDHRPKGPAEPRGDSDTSRQIVRTRAECEPRLPYSNRASKATCKPFSLLGN